jgi:hypothetical protein
LGQQHSRRTPVRLLPLPTTPVISRRYTLEFLINHSLLLRLSTKKWKLLKKSSFQPIITQVAKTTTIYSNLVNLRTGPTELVLEFAAVFPEVGPLDPSRMQNLEPDVRVVMSITTLPDLVSALDKALKVAQAMKQGQERATKSEEPASEKKEKSS